MSRVTNYLVELAQQYGPANRAMALVAVVKGARDRPETLPHTETVPLGMPEVTQYDARFGPPLVPFKERAGQQSYLMLCNQCVLPYLVLRCF